MVNVTASYIVPADGLLSATVSVTGAPTGTTEQVAWKACPQGASTTGCETFYVPPGMAQSMLLASGSWTVSPYYLAPRRQRVPGPTTTVTITGGQTTDASRLRRPTRFLARRRAASASSVSRPAWQSPATRWWPVPPRHHWWRTTRRSSAPASTRVRPARGSARPTATRRRCRPTPPRWAPAGFAGPPTAPYNVYGITSLTPGKWLLYPGYQTDLGSTMASTVRPVTVGSGRTVSRNLVVLYQKPSVGAVSGSGRGARRARERVRVRCAGRDHLLTSTSCPGEQQTFSEQGGTYQLVLQPGTWWISGFVEELSVTSQSQVTSPACQVTVVAGSTVTENFTVQELSWPAPPHSRGL